MPSSSVSKIDCRRLTSRRGGECRHAIRQSSPETLGGHRQLPRANAGDALLDSERCKALDFGRGQTTDEQVDVVEPDKAIEVSVMHHRMQASEQERMSAARTSGGWSERRD